MNKLVAGGRVLVLALLLFVAACGSATPAPTTGPLPLVRINYSARTGAHAALWYAYETGLFREYGVDVQLVELQGGPGGTLAAMLRGELEFTTGSLAGIVSSAVAGEDRALIANFYNAPLFYLVAGPEVQTPEDLIGKSIVVGSLGGFKHIMALLALEALGIEADQVNFVPLRDNDEPLMVASIEGGTASAAVLAPPLFQKYQDLGLHVLVDISELDVDYVRLCLNSLRSYAVENHDTVVGVLKALLAAISHMKADPEGTQAILAQYTGLDPVTDAADLAAMYEVFVTQHLQTDLLPSTAALQYGIDLETPNNPEAAQLTPDQLVYLDPLNEVLNSGFLETLP